MTIRLYIDEDSMSRALVRALQARGIDVTTALAEGMIEQPDADHLERATQLGRVLFSFNVGDFYQLHTEYLASGKTHAGMVLCPQQRYSVGEQMRRLLKLVAAKPADEMKDTVEFLSAWE